MTAAASSSRNLDSVRAAKAFVGATLGDKYRIDRVLGVGGMGIVCEARHLLLGNKRFAVKLVQRYFAGSEIAAARFRREVRAIAAIESENIVQVTDVGNDDALGLYMVMEYLQGEDLSSYLHRVGTVKPIEAVTIAHQIARALAKAHAAQILHRDLKPGNVFLVAREDGSYHVKIFDFGISKHIGDADATGTWSANLTTVGLPVGTPQYMSPEQASGVPDLDARTDVYSLGVVLFEMLAGRGIYEAHEKPHKTILRILTENAPILRSVAPWVPEELARVVDAALLRERDHRIQSCGELAQMLEDAMPNAFPAHVVPHVTARRDDEVTVVTPMPRDPDKTHGPLSSEITAQLPTMRLGAISSPSHPPPSQKPTLSPDTVRTPAPFAAPKRRKRGLGLLFLGLAIAGVFGMAGPIAKRARAHATIYAATPAPAR